MRARPSPISQSTRSHADYRLPLPLTAHSLDHAAAHTDACTQVLGGWASKTYGGKPVLGCGVFFWSLATLLTPIAARTSLPVLICVRIGMVCHHVTPHCHRTQRNARPFSTTETV